MAAAAPKITLGYWDIRGLAAAPRMALLYAGVPFESKNYTLTKDDSGAWHNNWSAEYKEMEQNEHPFPNLPYMRLADGTLFVQSRAILRYTARLTKLDGATELERIRCDEIIEQTADLRKEFKTLCYGSHYAENVGAFVDQTLPYFLKGFEHYLQRHGTDFFAGAHVTVADFDLWDILDILIHLTADLLREYPLLRQFMVRVRHLPGLKTYFDSPFSALPPKNKSAHWGATALSP